jgi:preprotein translocase SecE subunit
MSSHELKSSLRYRLKRWFFGVGKEFSRVTWTGGKHILKDFFIIITIVTIMALLFLGVDYILRLANVIK